MKNAMAPKDPKYLGRTGAYSLALLALCLLTTPIHAADTNTTTSAATTTTPAAAPIGKHVKHWEKKFKKIDANGDGNITLDELQTYHDARAAKHAQNTAKKGNGKGVAKRFGKMDANGDGKVTLDEFIAYKQAHHHGGHKHNKPEANK